MGALRVNQIIEQALHELGIATDGEPVQPEDLALGLVRFNLMIDSWRARRLMIYQTLRQEFNVVPNQRSFTIGPGGDWNTQRPLAIAAAGFVNTAVDPTQPLETPIRIYTDEEWASIGLKTLTSTIVWGLWFETEYTQTAPVGLARIFPYPILTNSGTIALYLPIAIEEVADDENGLATLILLPPGYRDAMIKYLATDMAAAYNITLDQVTMGKMLRAMKVIERANIKPMTLRIPSALTLAQGRRNGYNILTNQWK